MPTAEMAARSPIEQMKADLRRNMRALRRSFHDARPPDVAETLAERFDHYFLPPPDAVISGYWPAGAEIDVLPLLRRLFQRGHPIVLPVVVEREQPMIFRRWAPGDPLMRGNGAEVPLPDREAVDPDWLLVPLLAFDPAGNRLGQGAGYYDRTLARLRTFKQITAIGIAYSVQQCPSLPVTPADEPLEAILTEAGVVVAPVPESP